MKQLAILLFTGLMVAALFACGGETAEPTDAPVPTAAPTQPAAQPTNTPAPTDTPAPTATTAPPPAPTDTPVPAPTATSAPEPTATPEPEPTAIPEPTATPEPEPTATPEPEPTATPEAPTATPEPAPTATPAPAPEPTAEPELPIAADLAPLGDNLRLIAYLDRATQSWKVYAPTGDFKPEDIPLPPGMAAPDASDIGALTELEPGEIYTIVLNENQAVELNGNSYNIYANSDFLVWK